MKAYLLRHAKAERRLEWDAPDPLRPLSPRGLRQARRLAEELARQPLRRIVTSPHIRCVQTVEPLSRATGIPVEYDERLAEGESAGKALDLLGELGDEPVVCCSHGDLIPALVAELEERGVAIETDGAFRCEKGSAWVVEGKGSQPRSASYRPAPQAEREEDGDRERIAVLDLGSTSFRLVVVEATRAGRLTRLVNERIMLRLGAAITLDGRIPEPICAQAVATAGRLGELARDAGATRLLPVGTAALRDADNGRELADRIGAALSAPVRLVSGEEEARLLFLAFRRRVLLPQRPTLGIDLGGGSLELVVGDPRGIHWEATLRVGVTRLHRELVKSDPMRKREARAIREQVRDKLEPHRATIAELGPGGCIASGGTARAFARLAVARRGLRPSGSIDQVEIPVEELAETTRGLVRASHDERLAMAGVRKNRADLLPTGGLVLTTLAESLGIHAFTVCDWGLREGVLLEALDAPR